VVRLPPRAKLKEKKKISLALGHMRGSATIMGQSEKKKRFWPLGVAQPTLFFFKKKCLNFFKKIV